MVAKPGQVRIIGGAWRSRKLPVGAGVRPAPDMIRETLFNLLKAKLAGAIGLDLFAGSGCLGFELLSRGGAKIDLVELNPDYTTLLRQSIKKLEAQARAQVHETDVLAWVTTQQTKYDVVFIDPPYHLFETAADWNELLAAVSHLFAHDAMVYCKSAIVLTPPSEKLRTLRSGNSGQAHWALFAVI